ncbi:MAG: hypothetical protein M1840_001534 [Geoglossum simile]|nr:MAG: hypothetical protein M1840_001534 [Geoglossum simile]
MALSASYPPGMTRIDPKGDVVFEVGTNDLRAQLLVSSKVLGLASPVFMAMFKRGFQEGENLFSGSLHPVHLPDDDPETVTILCNILHLRHRQIPRVVTLETLTKMAVICDKYDCKDAVTSWSIIWLQSWADCTGIDELERLLFITYGLDIPDMFTRISRSLVTLHAGSLGHSPTSAAIDILPEDIFGDIEHHRESIYSDLQRAIENGISPMVKGHDTDRQCVRSIVGLYFQNLLKVGLWPLSDSLRKYSVSDIITKISDLEELEDDSTRCSPDCLCMRREYIKPRLQEALEDIFRDIEGFCLDCAKTEGFSSEEQSCRIPHPVENWRVLAQRF